MDLEDRVVPVTLPPGFTISEVVGNLVQATVLEEAPDGRLFIAEQAGAVKIVSADGRQTTLALQLNVDFRGERGLVGLALDPNFAANGFVYLYYTHPAGGGGFVNRISRFVAAGDTINPASEVVILTLDPLEPDFTIHNGGTMRFGPDGKLYVSVGDNAQPNTAQSPTTYFGKILRINPDGSIPPDNPASIRGLSAATRGKYRAIIAAGLRNPFNFDIDPNTNRLFVNDVGQDRVEELNEVAPGGNYGWPQTEGDFNPAAFPGFTRPIFAYPHGPGLNAGFAITGGTFFRTDEQRFPAEYQGDYFFADFVNDWIRTYDPNTGAVSLFASDLSLFGTVDLDPARDGSLLLLARRDYVQFGDGKVYRIEFTTAPQIADQPDSLIRLPGEEATFRVEASSAVAPSYQWQRNEENIPGATGPSYTLANPQLGDDGTRYRVIVTNPAGSVTSESATLTVTTNQRPVPTITLPADGTTFFAGETIVFAGSATDAEDGVLPASAFTWRVDYFTGPTVQRPFFPETSGIAGGSVVIPTRTPFTLPNVFYRFSLTVRDSFGHTVTTTRDILPLTASVSVVSNPPGATIAIDGQPMASPIGFVGVVGIERELAAAETIGFNGQLIPFSRWSDGSTDRVRGISTPAQDTTFQAVYEGEPVGFFDPFLAIGSGAGRSPAVRTIDAGSGAETGYLDLSAWGLSDVRVARADVTGDGVAEIIAGNGPGGPPTVLVFDGTSNEFIAEIAAFESTFTGGVLVAAGDLDGDGIAEIVVSPDVGGGPRVRVFRNGDAGNVLFDFFGIDDPNFRGGARVSLGDLTGDGRNDLLVAAGIGGGPRIAGYDGLSIAAGNPARIFADFFVFEETLRNGAVIATGDVDADGFADLIAGGGPGGGPRVLVLSGANLVQSNAHQILSNFFAGDENARNGLRVGAIDLEGDSFADIVVASAPGESARIAVYRGIDAIFDGNPSPFRLHAAFDDGFTGGVYVG
ncbi:MAG: PQQ-dependent sugar dehydrogenase [Gemmataceae bacterium]|nr:PQQ-dependent sugar dehydrogenase [Gemmataceae bacterium]